MNIQRILSITASAIFFCAQLETASAQPAPTGGNGGETTSQPNGAEEGGILPFGSNPYNSMPGGPMKGAYGMPGMIPGGQMPFPQTPFIPPIPGQISQFPNPGFGPGYGMGCTPVSVRGDATYCVQGPVCSGSGYAPVGLSCPVAGDMAVDDCKPGLPSSAGGMGCRLPMHSRCVQVNFNAWGCALENDWGMPNGGWNHGPGPFPPTPFPPTPIQSQWGAPQQQFGAPQQQFGVSPIAQRQWGK